MLLNELYRTFNTLMLTVVIPIASFIVALAVASTTTDYIGNTLEYSSDRQAHHGYVLSQATALGFERKCGIFADSRGEVYTVNDCPSDLTAAAVHNGISNAYHNGNFHLGKAIMEAIGLIILYTVMAFMFGSPIAVIVGFIANGGVLQLRNADGSLTNFTRWAGGAGMVILGGILIFALHLAFLNTFTKPSAVDINGKTYFMHRGDYSPETGLRATPLNRKNWVITTMFMELNTPDNNIHKLN